MRFALLGKEQEGVALARALIAADHRLLYVTDVPRSQPWPADVKRIVDVEEILADPEVQAIIVGSSLDQRANQVRRALQSERAVFCLHPIDTRPDTAYEAGMLQQDTRQLLLPLLFEGFHPAIVRLRSLLTNTGELGELRLLEIEEHSSGEVLRHTDVEGGLPCVPHWDILRAVGGEIAEVAAVAPGEVLEGWTPVVVSGRFAGTSLFQVSLIPGQSRSHFRLRVVAERGDAELHFPLGLSGPCFLSRQSGGERIEEAWDAWNPWPDMVPIIEEAFAGHNQTEREPAALSWQDAIRCLELDDAARRSVYRRKIVALEYPEASEEVTFKGTMTLVGCAMLWVIIFLAILSRWYPQVGLAVAPVLVVFLLFQLLRWIIPSADKDGVQRPTLQDKPPSPPTPLPRSGGEGRKMKEPQP